MEGTAAVIKLDITKEYSTTEVKDDFDKKDINVNIRKIKNGYIVRRSWSEPSEDDSGRPYDKWCEEEEYYQENPL